MTNFAYNDNIPASANNPSQDQPKMQVNTASSKAILAVDHFTFGVDNGGTHQQVTLTNEVTPSIPAGASAALYSSNPTTPTSGVGFPYWVNSDGAFQMFGAKSLAANGYITLGGLIIQWGTFSAPGSDITTATTYSIPFPTNVFCVNFSPASTSGGNDVDVFIKVLPTLTGFSVRNRNGTTWTISWIAIGN